MTQLKSRLAKLTPPTLPVVLTRARLFRVLDRARTRPLTWIAAPAGFGKTTLVASYLKARRRPVCWYRLDEGDADPATFFHYLSLAAKSLVPRIRRPLPVLTPEYALGLPTFTRRFFQVVCAVAASLRTGAGQLSGSALDICSAPIASLRNSGAAGTCIRPCHEPPRSATAVGYGAMRQGNDCDRCRFADAVESGGQSHRPAALEEKGGRRHANLCR